MTNSIEQIELLDLNHLDSVAGGMAYIFPEECPEEDIIFVDPVTGEVLCASPFGI